MMYIFSFCLQRYKYASEEQNKIVFIFLHFHSCSPSLPSEQVRAVAKTKIPQERGKIFYNEKVYVSNIRNIRPQNGNIKLSVRKICLAVPWEDPAVTVRLPCGYRAVEELKLN